MLLQNDRFFQKKIPAVSSFSCNMFAVLALMGGLSAHAQIDSYRAEFNSPGSDYRAQPFGMRGFKAPAAYVEKLASGGWGGAHLEFGSGGVDYLREPHGSNNRVIHAMTPSAFSQALKNSGSPDLVVSPATPDIYYQHRILPEGDLYYLMNNGKTPFSGGFRFRASGKAELWNPASAEMKKIDAGSDNTMELTLQPRSGLFVLFSR